MRAYSADLRSRVRAAVLGGRRPAAVADRFGVSASWVRRVRQRVRQRHRDGGEAGPSPRGHRPQLLPADHDRIRRAVADDPDATLAELEARLGLAVHPATLRRTVRRLGLTPKMSRRRRPSRTARACPPPGPNGGRTGRASAWGGWCS